MQPRKMRSVWRGETMKRDFLKNLGLEEEVVEKIMTENGKEITTLKTEIANLKEDLNVKDGVIETKNSKIAELESVDIEALKSTEYERGKSEGSAEIQKFKFESALDNALKAANVKDSKAISGLLDMATIKLEDEKIVGLDEQINSLKESHDYLFEGEKKAPTFSDKTPGFIGNKSDDEGIAELKRIMGIKNTEK